MMGGGRLRLPDPGADCVGRSVVQARLIVEACCSVASVRWYQRYGLSYRDVEELLAERD